MEEKEYKLPYTAEEIKNKLRQVDDNKNDISKLQEQIDGYNIEPKTDDIPKVFLNGDEFSNMTTAKNEVNMELYYVSKTYSFHSFIKIKFQGTSSLTKRKKNFTIKMYKDESRETKLKKLFKDWKIEESKYVLKANFIDHSHARNIVSARLWNEVVASRKDYDSLPTELKSSPRNGAVDGFPVKLYVNGTYQGIYTWNIGKDDWMWNMDEDNPNHVLLCAETNTDGVFRETPCNFRALWNGSDGKDWSVEVGTNSTSVKNSLNTLILCVKDTNDVAFKATISNYVDIQSAIDYYIHQYIICGLDGLGKNMLIGTYDLVKWILGAYDMDSTFGLWWDGTKFVPTDYACPEDYQEQFNLLFERIEKLFINELKERYFELRKTVYSLSNMFTHFERFMDTIGSELYAEDLTIYTDIPLGSTNNIKQIRNYIRDRLAYCDGQFEAMTEPIPCTSITLDVSALTFTEEGSQTLVAMVEPTDTTDNIIWTSNDNTIATVKNGVVTAVANGSCTITATCGNYSASCSVSVSGIAEPIPCTGITLDKTSLSFRTESTQTLIATVTPTDTTDEIIWKSSAENIAIVENGIITPISEGSAIITATCGDYSATCSIEVDYRVQLPDGYTELEYITTDGNSYINTEIMPTEHTGAEYKLTTDNSLTGSYPQHVLCGNELAFPAMRISGGIMVNKFGVSTTNNIQAQANTTYVVSAFVNDNTFTVNDITRTANVGTVENTIPLHMFAHGNLKDDARYCFHGKVYYMRIYEAGVMIRNFVPCINDSGVVGLYDSVQGVFYDSDTETPFTAGTVVS